MATETPDVHADPTLDHLSSYASDEAIAAAEERDHAIQEEHFRPDALLDSSDSDVPTSEKHVGDPDGSVDSVLPPSSLIDEEQPPAKDPDF